MSELAILNRLMLPSQHSKAQKGVILRGRNSCFSRAGSRNAMSDEPTNFKVTDRRLFNPDGSPREIPPDEQPAPKVPSEAATASVPPVESQSAATEAKPSPPLEQPAAAAVDAEDAEEELLDADDPAGFVNFIMSIASNAASSLGMMEHPVTHKREVDLDLAKHWIDVLGMMEKKTRNNLLPQEEKILEGLLADLRMQYVSLTSSAGTSARAFTGRDIVGG